MSSIITQQFYLYNTISYSDYKSIDQVRSELFAQMNDGYPIYLSNESNYELTKIQNVANRIKNKFSNLVIIGTGASHTIPSSIASLSDKQQVNIYYLDNADQSSVTKLLSKLEPKDTAFLAISKSGETIEVLALTLLCINWISLHLGAAKLAIHFFVITNDSANSLRKISQSLEATILNHPLEVGGRYAVFSCVGLLIAAIVGFNIGNIIQCAKEAFTDQIKPTSWVCEGASYLLSMSRLYTNLVFMIYGDQFSGISNWYRQLLAESLGKESQGINPIIAAGLVDQHSQLQLYLDGPNDKFFTFLTKTTQDKNIIHINNNITDTSLDFLEGRSLGDIMDAQFVNIKDLLLHHRKNMRIICTDSLQEEFIAEFMTGQMLEIILFAFAQDINPFNQPAVEKIKDNIKVVLNKQSSMGLLT